MSKTVPSVKLQAYASVDLDRLSYRSGDVVYDKTNGTLRVMNGEIPGGTLLATRAYVLSNGGSGGGTVNSGVAGKLAYYSSTGTIVDDLSSVGWSGSTLSVTGSINVTAQKNYVRFHWDTLADLNSEVSPVTWHGMIAHVHETGRVYFAHSGAWTPLANLSDVTVAGIQAGTNVTVSSSGGVYTINAVTGSGGGGITLEESQDGAASLFSTGSHTGIAFSYNDASNSISATVGSVTLGTGTSGNYVASVQTGSGISGGSAGSAGAALTLAIDTAIVSTLTGSQTLTNKTISGASNTISNIGNGSLTNSSITINGTSVSLGGTISISSASNLDGLTDVTITTPATGQVLKYNGSQWINDADATTGGAGAGTVTSVSVTGANGFTGTVATASSTPAITITTSITGVLKGNATAISAAVSGTDYAPGTSALATGIVKSTTTTGALTIAVAGTDYQAPVGTISGIVKGNGANALTAATAGTDYQAPVSATGILKSSGVSGNVSAAVAGTDYQAPITLTTTGSSGAATFSSGTLNIPQYSGGGASTFSGLSDATSAALTVDEIYLQATTRLIVTANGSSAYLFDQYTGNNPTVYATSGTTIAFDLGTGALSSHPFLIRLSGANYNTGLTHVTSAGVITTGSSAQGKTSGTLYWKIPADISGTYGYLCAAHGSMAGTITINPATVTATSLSLGNVTNESKVTMFTSPTLSNITVNGGVTFGSAIAFSGSGYQIGKDGADFLAFSGGSAGTRFINASTATEWMRIDSSGNVTINSDQISSATSHVASQHAMVLRSATTNQRSIVAVAPNGSGGAADFCISSTSDLQTNYNQIRIGSDGTGFFIASEKGGTETTKSLRFGVGGTALTIDTSNNVGIGTSSPSVKFQVDHSSDVAAINASGGGVTLKMSNSSANDVLLRMTNNSSNFYDIRNLTSGSAFTIGYNGDERMRIDSSGKVYFGTTTNVNAGAMIVQQAANGTGITVNGVNNTSGAVFMYFTEAGANCGYIQRVGTTGAVVYSTSSDYRLKKNIAPMAGALATVAKLKPVTYDWKAGGSSQGFIAHELQEVIPDAVTGVKDQLNEDGSINSQGIDQSRIVATLTAAIQEQQVLITSLTARIAALESK